MGLRRLEWGQGIGGSGVSCSQVLAGCDRWRRGVDGGVRDDEAMVVDTVEGEDVVLFSFRPRPGASTGDCGGVTRAAGVVAELEAGVGERSSVLLASGASLTSTTTELDVDKADTLDDALDRAGESVGVRNGTVGIGRAIGIVLLITGAGGVNGRCRDAGRGEGGGVERPPCLVFLGRGSEFEVV